ncbi:hypothetical protein B0T26DRAFT_647943 [Lasiosphaeria miniovina]|uniref:Uncharacterized protein n=1 Tax=Lasiosphaeria miniovina TaxID=1954250 RepID=A0AA40AKD0_9PEZI|nr:uncharacterized protein B0T26DRAFT_647943 [Lasiosphaeria miniovina]KAK0717400.1 hypothetical protein B0T26DRAFT_647943 [Lasiosphaeria miniovina]
MNTAATSSSVGPLPEPPRAAPQPNVNHNRDLALQKYLLLHEQHESLRQHLDELRPLHSLDASVNSVSTASSPTMAGSVASLSSSSSQAWPYQPRPPLAGPYRRASTALTEVAVEEAKLCDVNEGIKRTLTELLNCEAVRGDRSFRTWVQCRLMDTERELRSGRRRRSAPEP